MEQFKTAYGDDWNPIEDEFLYSYWLGYEATLVAGGERAGAPRGGQSRVYLTLTENHLLGNFNQGLGVDGDNKTTKPLSDTRSLLFVWPLGRIESISVERKKGLLGTSDVQIMIKGANSVFKAPSVKFHNQGDKYPTPYPDVSKSQAFGRALADAINRASGTTATWKSGDTRVAGLRILEDEIFFSAG